MSTRYQLAGMNDAQLVAGLHACVHRSNEVTSDLLAYLAAMDERMLYAVRGYSSLHAYCTEHLHLSESAAGRRITAARVCRRFPKVYELVAAGELHLSAVCALKEHLTPENAEDLFRGCRHKSRREVEYWLACRFPKAPVRESIRRLPEPRGAATVPANSPGEAAVPAVKNTHRAEPTPPHPLQHQAEAPSPPPSAPEPRAKATAPARIEPISAERYGVHFTADAELVELIEKAKALASHRLPAGDLPSLLRLALGELVASIEKQRFGVGRKPRQAKPSETSETASGDASDEGTRTEASRYVTAEDRRAVYAASDSRCTYVSPDGKRCAESSFLEVDHVVAHGQGGKSKAANLRIYCRTPEESPRLSPRNQMNPIA